MFASAGCSDGTLRTCEGEWGGWSGWQEAEYEPYRNRSRFYSCEECAFIDTEYTHVETHEVAEKFCGYSKIKEANKECDFHF